MPDSEKLSQSIDLASPYHTAPLTLQLIQEFNLKLSIGFNLTTKCDRFSSSGVSTLNTGIAVQLPIVMQRGINRILRI